MKDETEKSKLFREWIHWEDQYCPVCDKGYKQFNCICKKRAKRQREIEIALKDIF